MFITNEQVITKVRGIRTVPRFQRRFDSSFPEPSWLKCWCDEVFGNCLRKLIHPSPYRSSNFQLIATEEDNLESILRRVESPNLIWLRWNNCPYTWLPKWIPMKNIRVLEVSGNKLETLWRAESQVKANAGYSFCYYLLHYFMVDYCCY